MPRRPTTPGETLRPRLQTPCKACATTPDTVAFTLTSCPLTQVRAGGSSKQSARRTMRAVSEMWCVIVGPIVICEHLCRFHAVAVSCCGGMLHLWSCVLDTCVGGRPRVAHTTDTKVSFRTCLFGTPSALHADGMMGLLSSPIGATQRTRGTYAPRLPRRPTTPGETLRPLRLAWAVWSTAPPPSSAGVLARVWRLSATSNRTKSTRAAVEEPEATLRTVGCRRARRLWKPVGDRCP